MNDLIEAYVSWMGAAGYSDRYVSDRKEVLGRVSRRLPFGLERALPEELVQAVNNPRWAPASKRHAVTAIQGFFAFACSDDDPWLTRNPSLGLRRPKVTQARVKPATDEQLAEILARADEPWRTCVVLAAGNGLRCCSIAVLHTDDVDEDELIVDVKGGRTAYLDTHPMIWEAVRGLPPGLVIEQVGGVADARWISQKARKYFHGKLRIPVSMHMFRRWHATKLDELGCDLLTISQAMCHARISTTQGYIFRKKNGKRRAAIHALPVPAAA